MLKQLRRRFITVAMVAVIAIIVIIVGSINIINFHSTMNDIDRTMQLLRINEGKLPQSTRQTKEDVPQNSTQAKEVVPQNSAQAKEIVPKNNAQTEAEIPQKTSQQENVVPKPKTDTVPSMPSNSSVSAEAPYTTRYFTIHFDNNGEITADTENIAAVDDETAISMAQLVLEKGKETGFLGYYRYLTMKKEQVTRVVFLDCTNKLSSVLNYFYYSCIIALAGMVVVFLLLLLVSGRVVKPITEAYEKQKQFITDAGHELKTPLTIIRADAELWGTEDPENEWFRDICLQVDKLAELTEHLIFLSRMDEERTSRIRISFPLSDIVLETIQSFQAVANRKGCEIHGDIQPMLSMNGDENAIRQMVSILLDNALKHGVPNQDVYVSLHRRGANTVFSVENSVEYIEKGKHGLLFERFYRADTSRNSQTGGHGLGLSIAKSIVDAHKGNITAYAPSEETLIIKVQLPK